MLNEEPVELEAVTISSEELVRLQNIDLRLERIERQLEVVATLACPVCRPGLVTKLHPEADWHDRAEWSVVRANGTHEPP